MYVVNMSSTLKPSLKKKKLASILLKHFDSPGSLKTKQYYSYEDQ